jgi:AraC-like DNA-binding protein
MPTKTTDKASEKRKACETETAANKVPNAHRSFNLAIARYGDLVDAIIDLSHRGDPKAEVNEALIDRIDQVISELVAERNIGVLAGLLQLMGGGHPDLQQIAIQTLVSMDREAVTAIVEEVTTAPTAFEAPGAMLLLAMMGTPQALSALEGLWSRLDLPYPLRARALRLLAACKTGFFDEQWGFSEELKPDAETLRDLLELLGNTLLKSLSAFHLEWLGSPDNLDFNLALLSLSSFVWRKNEFCNLVRTNGFEDRCLACDRAGMDRAIASRKKEIYRCHAGLTDIIIPILSDKRVVGLLITGQFTTTRLTSDSFQKNCKDLTPLAPGLRRSLERAYVSTPCVAEERLDDIVRSLQIVARLLLSIWHKTQRMVQKTKQLQCIKYFGRRELVESLLFGEITREEMETRLKDLGIRAIPNYAVLIRLVGLDERTHGRPERGKMLSFERAVLLVADLVEHKVDALVTPLRYGEIVVLLESPAARNPHLTRLRQKELAQEMLQTLEQDAHLSAVAAVGHVSTGMSGLRESLERAREVLLQAISRGVVGVVHCDEAGGVHSDSVAQLSQIDARMAEALCSEDDALFDRVLDEEFSSVRLDAGNGSASLLVSIAGSAAELAVRAGAPRENVFPIKMDFLNRVRVLKEPAEVRPLLADLREALRKAIGNAQVGRVEHQIAGAREYLDHHYAEDISREELAAAANMSPWHLTTAFHRIVGMSPRDYLHRARIEAAKKRLLTTTDSVSEIAYSIGYGATSNFRRIFYKWVRCSPTTYRRHTPRSS